MFYFVWYSAYLHLHKLISIQKENQREKSQLSILSINIQIASYEKIQELHVFEFCQWNS